MTLLNLTPKQAQRLLLFIDSTETVFKMQNQIAAQLGQLDITSLKQTEEEVKKLTVQLESFLKENGLSKIVIENKK